MKGKLITINPEALASELKKRGLTNPRVDAETGYTPGQMSRVLSRGAITPQNQKILEALYHIDPKSYEQKDEPAPAEKGEQICMNEPGVPKEVQDAIYGSALKMVESLESALTEDVILIADYLERIAVALEKIEKGGENPAVLPWGTDEMGGDF